MRYFKWGVARLILESDPCPAVVPIWIEGFDKVMPEDRGFPRWWPRWRKRINVAFGDVADEETWAPFRDRWKRLKEKLASANKSEELSIGVLNDELKYSQEAVNLRIEVALAVREQLLRLRKERGWSDEDPKEGIVDTWRKEGWRGEGKKEDGSWVGDT
jgi:monolysocardiolipin acyltransferase